MQKYKKEENMQKEQQNKKITFAPAISTSYLFCSYSKYIEQQNKMFVRAVQ